MLGHIQVSHLDKYESYYMSRLYESFLVLPVNYLVAIAFMEAVYVYGLNKMQRVQHVGGN